MWRVNRDCFGEQIGTNIPGNRCRIYKKSCIRQQCGERGGKGQAREGGVVLRNQANSHSRHITHVLDLVLILISITGYLFHFIAGGTWDEPGQWCDTVSHRDLSGIGIKKRFQSMSFHAAEQTPNEFFHLSPVDRPRVQAPHSENSVTASSSTETLRHQMRISL